LSSYLRPTLNAPGCSPNSTPQEIAFGLCDLGMGESELGYVSLTELLAVRGKLGLPVERDEHFEADKTLSAYADEARQHGGIVT
jgi:hypothetical protein